MENPTPITNTILTFPKGEVRGEAKVVLAERRKLPSGLQALLLVTDTTPFHPLDHTWPDQPGDTGTVGLQSRRLNVTDSITGAVSKHDETQTLYLGQDIPVRRGDEGWSFLVVHVIVDDKEVGDPSSLYDQPVILSVDTSRRHLLNAAHTAGHLAGFALSKAAADLWRKEVQLDGLGNPDLDQLAREYSRIAPNEVVDKYRFGKSLRKRGGFDSTAFFEHSKEITASVNEQVRQWIETKAEVTAETTGDTVDAHRYWVCTLDGKTVKLPCGGTHPQNLGEIASITVELECLPEVQECIMRTQLKLL